MTKSLKNIFLTLFAVAVFFGIAFVLPACKQEETPAKTYSVLFYDEDKETLIEKIDVSEGSAASITTPTKESTEIYEYSFEKWIFASGTDATSDLENVSCDMAVYATFKEQQRTYSVTFYSLNDNNDIFIIGTKAGESLHPLIDGILFDSPKSNTYTYTFSHWADAPEGGNDMTEQLGRVVSDMIVYAQYDMEEIRFSVNFEGNGSEYIDVIYGENGSPINSSMESSVKFKPGTEIKISYSRLPSDQKVTNFTVQGVTLVDGETDIYIVVGDVKITLDIEPIEESEIVDETPNGEQKEADGSEEQNKNESGDLDEKETEETVDDE